MLIPSQPPALGGSAFYGPILAGTATAVPGWRVVVHVLFTRRLTPSEKDDGDPLGADAQAGVEPTGGVRLDRDHLQHQWREFASLYGPTAAKIFNGAITRWSDPAIQALNSGATLPAEPIHIVFRSAGPAPPGQNGLGATDISPFRTRSSRGCHCRQRDCVILRS